MATVVALSDRDRSLLRVLSHTPATTELLTRASALFDGGPFRDNDRLRERLRTLANSGYVRIFSAARTGGGTHNYYTLTPTGFQALFGVDAAPAPRSLVTEVPPSRFAHTMALAEIIVHTLVSCQNHRVIVSRYYRENELTLSAGERSVQPDFVWQFCASGKMFNSAFEIDMGTEPLQSHREQSIRSKIVAYEAHQDVALGAWKAGGEQGERPAFRVVFLTQSVERAYHILALAGELARNRARRLVYAATQGSFLAEHDAVNAPLFLCHRGTWQALVNLHPTSDFLRTPVRITKPLAAMHCLC